MARGGNLREINPEGWNSLAPKGAFGRLRALESFILRGPVMGP
jgi:hypothetical protein